MEFTGKVAAVISIVDQAKREAPLAIWTLHRMGMNVVLLTGDNAKTAEATAKKAFCTTKFNHFIF